MVRPSSCSRKCRCFFHDLDLTFFNMAPAFITWRSLSPLATVQDQGLPSCLQIQSIFGQLRPQCCFSILFNGGWHLYSKSSFLRFDKKKKNCIIACFLMQHISTHQLTQALGRIHEQPWHMHLVISCQKKEDKHNCCDTYYAVIVKHIHKLSKLLVVVNQLPPTMAE